MLLKITHLPIVGAIWIFESASDSVRGSVPEFSSIGPEFNSEPIEPTNGSRPSQSSSKRRQKPFLSKSSARPSSNNLHNSPVADDSHKQSAETPELKNDNWTGGDRNEGLERKVDNLTAKIAELTALVMAQQDSSSVEP